MQQHPYGEELLEQAVNTLGKAFDFADKRLPGGMERFYDIFCASELSHSFGGPGARPNIEISGIEFVMAACKGIVDGDLDTLLYSERRIPRDLQDRGRWCGRALAYHQWETGRSFRAISLYLGGEDLSSIYSTYRTATPRAGAAIIERDYAQAQEIAPTHLRELRVVAGLTQVQLADASGVGLRSIQQYEQRKKDINRAQARSVARLASALSCRMEDLLED